MTKILYENTEYQFIITYNGKELYLVDYYFKQTYLLDNVELDKLTKKEFEKLLFDYLEKSELSDYDKADMQDHLSKSEFYKSLKDDEEKEKSKFRNNYFLNDEVYVIANNKVVKGRIKTIHLCGDNVFYDILYGNDKYRVNDLTEECFYKTNDECLNAFIEKIRKENQ